MTLPTQPPGGGPRQPKGIPAGGEFAPTVHAEPTVSLGGPTPRERLEARREAGEAVREPLKGMLSRMRPHPQDFVFEANHEGTLVGAALDPTGQEIPGSRHEVGKALLERGIRAGHVMPPGDMAAGRMVVAVGDVMGWRSADEPEQADPAPMKRPVRPRLSTDPVPPFPTGHRKDKP